MLKLVILYLALAGSYGCDIKNEKETYNPISVKCRTIKSIAKELDERTHSKLWSGQKPSTLLKGAELFVTGNQKKSLNRLSVLFPAIVGNQLQINILDRQAINRINYSTLDKEAVLLGDIEYYLYHSFKLFDAWCNDRAEKIRQLGKEIGVQFKEPVDAPPTIYFSNTPSEILEISLAFDPYQADLPIYESQIRKMWSTDGLVTGTLMASFLLRSDEAFLLSQSVDLRLFQTTEKWRGKVLNSEYLTKLRAFLQKAPRFNRPVVKKKDGSDILPVPKGKASFFEHIARNIIGNDLEKAQKMAAKIAYHLDLYNLSCKYRIVGLQNQIEELRNFLAAKSMSDDFAFLNTYTQNALRSLANNRTNHLVSLQEDPKSPLNNISSLISTIKSTDLSTSRGDAIFLTGGTGFLGAHLIHDLCTLTQRNIYCLVRAKSTDEGFARLLKNITTYYSDVSWVNRDRIIPVLGDLEQPNLGISQVVFDEISETVKTIYHNGAIVHHLAGYDRFRKPNVLSLQSIIKLATNKRKKEIIFTSSIAPVSEKDHNTNGVIPEEFLGSGKCTAPNGYGQSKYVTERILTEVKDYLPVKIFRICQIIGRTDTGKGPTENEHVVIMFKNFAKTMRAPNWTYTTGMLPVDFVSEAMVKISQENPLTSGVFHFVNYQQNGWNIGLSYNKNPIKIIPETEWEARDLLKIPARDDLFSMLGAHLKGNDPLKDWNAINFSTEKTQQALQKIGMYFPNMVKDGSFQRWYEYIISQKQKPLTAKL